MIKGTVTAPAQEFIATVKWAARFVSSRPAVPMQGGLMLDVTGRKLSIMGYNETVTARALVDVEGDGDGQVVVSGRLLAALAGTWAGKPIVITGHDNAPLITIRVGTWRGTLPVMTDGKFPSPPAAPTVIGRLTGSDVARAIDQVGAARSVDDKQAAMYHCMHLTFGAESMTALATNMYRAARAIVRFRPATAEAEWDHDVTAVVDAATMLDVADSFEDEDVWIGVGDMKLGLASPTRAVIMRQSGEAYQVLDVVRRIFTMQLPHVAGVEAKDLIQPMKRAQLVREKDGPIIVGFRPNLIELRASSEEIHQDSDEGIVAAYAGPPWELKFNPGYFAEALTSAPGDTVNIALTTERIQAVLITVPGNDSWAHALMPIKK